MARRSQANTSHHAGLDVLQEAIASVEISATRAAEAHTRRRPLFPQIASLDTILSPASRHISYTHQMFCVSGCNFPRKIRIR